MRAPRRSSLLSPAAVLLAVLAGCSSDEPEVTCRAVPSETETVCSTTIPCSQTGSATVLCYNCADPQRVSEAICFAEIDRWACPQSVPRICVTGGGAPCPPPMDAGAGQPGCS